MASGDDSFEVAVDKGTFHGQYTASSVIVTLSVALALYNSMELVLLIAATFKRRKGLYFWSLSLCNLGVMLYALGLMMAYFKLTIFWLYELFLDSGWMIMITCQALVLYSRLGLILNDYRILQAVKWMIIIVAIFIEVPVVVLDWGKHYSSNPNWAEAYFYVEHIQMTAITLQELIISGLYIWKTVGFLKVIAATNTRSMVWQLLFINVIIIAMDTLLVILQYKHLQLYQESIKGFVYSVKLKLELNILSRLVGLVQGPSSVERSMALDPIDSNTLTGIAKAEVRQEIHAPKALTRIWSTTVDKSFVDQHTNGHIPLPIPSSASGSAGEINEITQPLSYASIVRSPARRDSDDSYGEIIRSLSRS